MQIPLVSAFMIYVSRETSSSCNVSSYRCPCTASFECWSSIHIFPDFSIQRTRSSPSWYLYAHRCQTMFHVKHDATHSYWQMYALTPCMFHVEHFVRRTSKWHSNINSPGWFTSDMAKHDTSIQGLDISDTMFHVEHSCSCFFTNLCEKLIGVSRKTNLNLSLWYSTIALHKQTSIQPADVSRGTPAVSLRYYLLVLWT